MQRRLKSSSSDIPVSFPNGLKLYNSKMGGVDLMDQLKSALFFNLFDVALVDSVIVYKKLENKDLFSKRV